ncbi:MAG: hypothetical protein CMK32_09470 [Porticoccaceae bacterium]|nr:hypothetical protein [Porticoccaceae bacterium]
MDFPPAPDVAGTSLSGSEPYIISAEENRALCETVNAEVASDGSAHPIYYYIATQVGMGQTVAGVCEICDFDVEVGPMMAGSKVIFSRPLMTDQPYLVEGEITSIVRKKSRKLGVMDLMVYELRLTLPDKTPVLTTVNSWVLPRRELA